MNAATVVGYQFNSSLYCGRCAERALTLASIDLLLTQGQIINPALSFEQVLDVLAPVLGVNREDESSFDSSTFPKVVFADSVASSDQCCVCEEVLLG